MTLEATQERMDVWNACKGCNDWKCTGCPFRYTCEQIFPYIGRDQGANDYLPCDYRLSEDGTMFVVEEA